MEIDTSRNENARGKWATLAAALLGWMFDGFEIGLFPVVGPAAINELLTSDGAASSVHHREWFGVIVAVFLVGAATGGVLFGWLGDRVGRVRAMSLSVLTYALFTGLCGFATEAWHIAVLRFVASLGMGGEWALGVALVTEIWPDRSRAFTAGLIGAAANVGMLSVGLLSLVLVSVMDQLAVLMVAYGISEQTRSYLLGGEGWRLLMIAGAMPALLVFFIRLFVPESGMWEAQRASGGTSLWATRDLVGVLLGAVACIAIIALWSPAVTSLLEGGGRGDPGPVVSTTSLRVVGTALGLVFAFVGYIYPVLRYLRRAENANQLPVGTTRKYIARMCLGAAIAGIPLLGTWGSLQWAPKWATALANHANAGAGFQNAKELTQIALAVGAIFGTIAAAWLAGRIGRRITYVLLCIASFLSLVYMYQGNDSFNGKMLVSVSLAGATTAAFYGWFPLYLPELFPTRIRATAQGFAFNFGRVLSAIGSLQVATLTAFFAQGLPASRVEVEAFPYAGSFLAGIYIVGIFIIWLGPETKETGLPE